MKNEIPESALQDVKAFEKYLLDRIKKAFEDEIDAENDRLLTIILNGREPNIKGFRDNSL